MKIQKLIKICKAERTLYLCDTNDGVQWLSNGKALFPLFNHPTYEEKSIFAAFGIDEKQQEKITFKHFPTTPAHIDISDAVAGEFVVERAGGISVHYGGKYLIPYKTQQGIMFINGDSLAPLADDDNKMLYERRATNGSTYFAIKSGFMISGIVLPENVIDDVFVRQIRDLHTQCDLTLYNQSMEKDSPQDEQQTIDKLKAMYGAGADSEDETDGDE